MAINEAIWLLTVLRLMKSSAAISLATSLLIQNVMLGGAGAPDYGAPIADVLAFHAKNRGTVAVSVGLEALNLPLLLGFLAGLHAVSYTHLTLPTSDLV